MKLSRCLLGLLVYVAWIIFTPFWGLGAIWALWCVGYCAAGALNKKLGLPTQAPAVREALAMVDKIEAKARLKNNLSDPEGMRLRSAFYKSRHWLEWKQGKVTDSEIESINNELDGLKERAREYLGTNQWKVLITPSRPRTVR